MSQTTNDHKWHWHLYPILLVLLVCMLNPKVGSAIDGGGGQAIANELSAEKILQTDVFISGNDGYHTFRIPAIIAAANGDLLAFAEGRVQGKGDSGNIDLVMKRSTDQGETWGALQVVSDYGDGCVGNPTPVVDQESGDVVLLVVRQAAGSHEHEIREGKGPGYRDPYVLRSTDHGSTWSEPVSLVDTCDRPEWGWYAIGPCHAIQIQNGQYAGRMVAPANFSVIGPKAANFFLGAHALISDDAGKTWRLGAIDASHIGNNELNPNESTVVELSNGRLMFNTRDQGGSSKATRAVTFSKDGGETFTHPFRPEERLVAPVCQGALLGIDTKKGRLVVFSGPSDWKKRRTMRLRFTRNEGKTWHAGPVIYKGSSAYSDLVEFSKGRIGCLYEADGYGRIVFAHLSVDDLLMKSE